MQGCADVNRYEGQGYQGDGRGEAARRREDDAGVGRKCSVRCIVRTRRRGSSSEELTQTGSVVEGVEVGHGAGQVEDMRLRAAT